MPGDESCASALGSTRHPALQSRGLPAEQKIGKCCGSRRRGAPAQGMAVAEGAALDPARAPPGCPLRPWAAARRGRGGAGPWRRLPAVGERRPPPAAGAGARGFGSAPRISAAARSRPRFTSGAPRLLGGGAQPPGRPAPRPARQQHPGGCLPSPGGFPRKGCDGRMARGDVSGGRY